MLTAPSSRPPRTKGKFNNIEFGAMGGSSEALSMHKMLNDKLGLRGEFQITASLIMSAYDRAVQQDLDEAYRCGQEAVKLAEAGETGFMAAMERVSHDPYEIKFTKAPLIDVAVRAKPMPWDFINKEGNFITDKFIEYAKPLVGAPPKFSRLEPVFV